MNRVLPLVLAALLTHPALAAIKHRGHRHGGDTRHSSAVQRHGPRAGIASFYGSPRSPDLTAAHRTLPFGTQVRVINTRNGKSAVVRINDRGPFIKGRVIDVSHAAARVLGMIQSGLAPVALAIVKPPPGFVVPGAR